MDIKVIVSVVAMVAFVAIIQTSKYWIGTKIGDVMITILGVSAAYGMVSGCASLYEWFIK